MKKLIKIIFTLSLLLIASIYFPNKTIVNNAKGKTFNTTSEIPRNKVGLLLGASKFVANGRINVYYTNRINAAVELYKAGKINIILVSGDNGRETYDEPTTFKEDLIKKGIPESAIVLDYAGFRTLDSVVRAKEIFGQDSITIISQEFHNQRAIYLAEEHNIKAIAYNAKDVSDRVGFKTNMREYLAKTKASLDILFNVKPKFLGEKIVIK